MIFILTMISINKDMLIKQYLISVTASLFCLFVQLWESQQIFHMLMYRQKQVLWDELLPSEWRAHGALMEFNGKHWLSSLRYFISGIKKYVVGLIIKTSSDAANVEVSEILLVLFTGFLWLLSVLWNALPLSERKGVHWKTQHDIGTGEVYTGLQKRSKCHVTHKCVYIWWLQWKCLFVWSI